MAALLILDAPHRASIRAVARQLGIPETTLRRWASGERSPRAKDAAPQYREQLAVVFERAAWECLAISPERLGSVGFTQLMTAAAVAAEKLIALRGAASLSALSAP